MIIPYYQEDMSHRQLWRSIQLLCMLTPILFHYYNRLTCMLMFLSILTDKKAHLRFIRFHHFSTPSCHWHRFTKYGGCIARFSLIKVCKSDAAPPRCANLSNPINHSLPLPWKNWEYCTTLYCACTYHGCRHQDSRTPGGGGFGGWSPPRFSGSTIYTIYMHGNSSWVLSKPRF